MSIKYFKNFSNICKSLHSPVLSTIFKTVWRSKSLPCVKTKIKQVVYFNYKIKRFIEGGTKERG